MDEISEALKFDPGTGSDEDDEISKALQFDPGAVGGTFAEPEAPGPGAPTPKAPFPEYPGAYRKFNEPEEPGPSFGTLMESNIVDDPLTKVKIFAKNRGIPPGDIARYYRFGKDGEIEFKTKSGKWQREIPEGVIGGAKATAAQIAGHPSTYAAVAGGLAGGPIGAALFAAGGEATRKQIAKEKYGEPQTAWGNAFDIGLETLLALGGETVGKIIKGQTNKYLMRKSKPLRFAGKEIKEGLLTPKDHAKALYIESLANQHGIKLQPHQLYNREGMTNIWMYLRKHPLTADRVQVLDEQLESSSNEAITGLIRELGGYDQDPLKMGADLKSVSGKAIKELEDARQGTAKPYYDAAFDRTPTIDIERLKAEHANNLKTIASKKVERIPDVKTMVQELNQSGAPTMKVKGESPADYKARISKAYKTTTGKDAPYMESSGDVANLNDLKKRNADIEKVLAGEAPGDIYVPKKIFKVDVTNVGDEIDLLLSGHVTSDPDHIALSRIKRMISQAEGDAEQLDNIKKNGIDTVLRKTKTQKSLSRKMVLIKKQLTDAMDEQIPDYSAARGIYGKFGMAKPIDEMKDSVIGTLANAEGYEQLMGSVSRIFGAGADLSDKQIAFARKVIRRQDPELWDRAIGEYIKKVYNQITVTEGGTVINSAGKMNKWLFGNPQRRKAMEAAFGGAKTPEFKALNDLMTVLQRASIGRSSQSMTASFQQIEKELAGQMETPAKQAVKHPLEFAVDKIFESWNNTLLAGRQGMLLDALSKPDVIKEIQKLKLLKPGSKKLIEGLSVLSVMVAPKPWQSGADPNYEGQKPTI